MLEHAIAVIGQPAAGKTTLTLWLGKMPGCCVFRLREHGPETMLAANAPTAERVGLPGDAARVAHALPAALVTAPRHEPPRRTPPPRTRPRARPSSPRGRSLP